MATKSGAAVHAVAKADASRSRILDCSARLFRERGYSAVSLRDIAAAAGMKAGSVYYHFESKEEIVLAVLNIGIAAVHEEVAHTIDALPVEAGAATLLRAGILAHLRSLFEFNDYTSANVRIYLQVPDEIRQANAAARRKYERLWTEILQRAEAQGTLRPTLDLKKFRLLLISSLNATLDWFDGAKGKIPALADSYTDMLLNGVLRDRTGS